MHRKHGGKLANLYQCSCAIDRIANSLSYDEFVEASTYAKYSGLPGEGGGIFRDSDQARTMAKRYREAEAEAYRSCGLRILKSRGSWSRCVLLPAASGPTSTPHGERPTRMCRTARSVEVSTTLTSSEGRWRV